MSKRQLVIRLSEMRGVSVDAGIEYLLLAAELAGMGNPGPLKERLRDIAVLKKLFDPVWLKCIIKLTDKLLNPPDEEIAALLVRAQNVIFLNEQVEFTGEVGDEFKNLCIAAKEVGVPDVAMDALRVYVNQKGFPRENIFEEFFREEVVCA